MGNQESSAVHSDDDTGHTYNYHKAILSEAECRVSFPTGHQQCPSLAGDGCMSDEEFFSADEGDSVRSITPPRIREESVSAGEHSEHSSGDEDNNNSAHESSEIENGSDNVDSNVESTTSRATNLTGNDFQVPVSPAKSLRSKRSCGQCNISTFQEHDSIGPEIESALENAVTTNSIANSSSMNQPRRSARQNSSLCSSKVRLSSATKPSPFKPIFSPSLGDAQATSDALIQVAMDGKRQSKYLKRSSPKPRRLTRSSRKRFGMFDDSSDSASEEELRGVTTKKKRKFEEKDQGRKQPLKRSRSRSHSENKTKEKRMMNKHATSSHSSSDSSEATLLRSRGRESRPRYKKGRWKHKSPSLSNSEASSDNSSAERKNSCKISAIRDKKKNNEIREVAKSGQVLHVNRLSNEISPTAKRLSSGHRLRIGAYNPVRPLREQRLLYEAKKTLTDKMGNQGMRNNHGKVVPKRLVQQSVDVNSLPSPPSDYVQNLTPQRSDNSAFSRTTTNVLGYSKDHSKISVPDSLEVVDQNVKKFKPGKSGMCTGSQRKSPFQNFSLVPPSQERTVSDSSNSNPINMETEMDIDTDNFIENETLNNESQTDMDHQAVSLMDTFLSQRPKTRHSIQTVRDRFKTFWSQKKNLGTNLKSLFHSKTTCSTPQLKKSSAFTSSPLSDSTLQRPLPQVSPSSAITRLSPIERLPHSFLTRKMSLRQRKRGNSSPSHDLTETVCLTSESTERIERSEVEETIQPLIQLLSPEIEFLPQTDMYQVLRFYAGGTEVSVSLGSVAEEHCEGIVNWTDGGLTHTFTQCSKDVATKAGALMRAGCHDYLENKGGTLEAPEVLTTPAGGTFDRRVIALVHVVAPPKPNKDENDSVSLQKLVEVNLNCLRYSDEKMGLASLAMPLIGDEMFPDEMCVQAFLAALMVFLAEHSLANPPSLPQLKLLNLVIPGPSTTDFCADFLSSLLKTVELDGLAVSVTKAYEQYLQRSKLVQICRETASLQSQTSTLIRNITDEDETQRTISGRPKIKRPRL